MTTELNRRPTYSTNMNHFELHSLPGHYTRLHLTIPAFMIFSLLCLYSTDCDIQLFSSSGVFENPTTSNTNHTCRILINAPPTVKIRIQALHIGFNSTNFQSTYIMVHTSFLTLAGFFLICCILNRKKKGVVTAPLFCLVQIRDMDVLKTNVFKGQQLFLWHSSGNMAEIEFHGDYLQSKGSFRAEYSFMRL